MKQIALINTCAGGAKATSSKASARELAAEAAAFVLADFKDAYAAYEGMSSPVTDEPSYEFVEAAEQANVVVLAYSEVDVAAQRLGKLAPATKVYGIQLDEDVLPSNAARGLAVFCKQHELSWMGELLITEEIAKIAALQHKPRLGWRRRRLSEATDRLIACVRAGISAANAADVFGATKKQRAFAARNLIRL